MGKEEKQMQELFNALKHVEKTTGLTMKDLMVSIYNAGKFMKHAQEKQKENPMLFQLYIDKINEAEKEKQSWIKKLFDYLK